MITCSTMNRSYPRVREAVQAYGVPVIPIDGPVFTSGQCGFERMREILLAG